MYYKLTGTLISDEGNKRTNNEDNYNLFGTYRKNIEINKSRWSLTATTNCALAAVYDGMGGEEAGEIASLVAAANITGCKLDDVQTAGLEALRNANRLVCEKAAEIGKGRIGTTMVGLYMDGDSAVCGNVGDSRCYLFRNGELKQLSIDHSEGQRLIDLGEDPETIRESRAWHQLTQHMGILEEEFIIEPYYTEVIKLETGDRFLLCSDGLTDMVLDNQVKEILVANPSEGDAGKALLQAALENGGKDNVTIMLVTVGEAIDENAVQPKERSLLGKIGHFIVYGFE